MAIDLRDTELRLVRERDGLSVNLRPLQGLWTEEQYLTLTDHTRHLIEFTDGTIEVLPTAIDKHQVPHKLIASLRDAQVRAVEPVADARGLGAQDVIEGGDARRVGVAGLGAGPLAGEERGAWLTLS
jgi:hypothetical protein